MGRFRRYITQLEVVEYTCSPVPEGWVVIIVSVLFAVLFGLTVIFKPGPDPVLLWLPWPFIFVFCLWGVYYVKFRRKPMKREVTLGGWYHRLWLRSKWRFIATGLAISLASATLGWAVCELVFEGYGAFANDFAHWLRGWFILLIALVYSVMRQYIAFYQYYRSPEYRQRMESTDETKKHGTIY